MIRILLYVLIVLLLLLCYERLSKTASRIRRCAHGNHDDDCELCRAVAAAEANDEIERLLDRAMTNETFVIGSAVCPECGEEVVFDLRLSADRLWCRNGHLAGGDRLSDVSSSSLADDRAQLVHH